MLVDAGEEAVEEVSAVVLLMVGGVVALALQGGSELDAGLEERAGFADGLEGAVEFGWSGAVAVALLATLRTYRDRAMAEAMVLGGLRRCEVLGLRLGDLQVPARRVFIAEGKGGHARLIPVSGRFFASSRPIWTSNGRPTPPPTGSSWCSRAHAGASR